MARKKDKKAKAKRRKFIAKISRDGKISKKEGQKAAKKGISLRSIKNRNISAYRDAVRAYENRDPEVYNPRNPTGLRPTFEPLKIKRGAERADFARQMREYGGRTQQPRRPRGGGSSGQPSAQPSTQPTNQYQSEIADILNGEPDQQVIGQPVADPYADALASLQQTIAGIQMPDYGAELDAMRAEQENYMRQLAEQQAAAERQRELAFRTSQENIARGGMQADFRIGARSPRDQMGTGGFKRRRRRRETVAQGIAPTTAGLTINI